MTMLPTRRRLVPVTLVLLMGGFILPAYGVLGPDTQPTLPDFSAAVFDNPLDINNPFFPLVPGTTNTYHAVTTDPETGETETETIVVEVLHGTRTVAGIETRIVRDRVSIEGLVIEDTFDWYAQDNAGNVWYMGEDVTDFEYDDKGNLIGTSHPGAWETGVDGALPGYIMEANPQVDDHYYQEFYPAGEAVDEGKVLGVGETLTIPIGTFENVLRTLDLSIDRSTFAHKFFAPGVGTIAEQEFLTETGQLIESVNLVPEPACGLILAWGAIGLFTRRR